MLNPGPHPDRRGARRAARHRPSRGCAVLAAAALLALAGCDRAPEAPEAEARPVRTIVVSNRTTGDSVALTGHIEAEKQATYAFRIGGRMIERLVNVGDTIAPGQVLARLDPQNEQNALRSAEAAVAAAQANLNHASNALDRQRQLLARGTVSRAAYEQAERAFLAAGSELDNAEAQHKIAEDRLDFTELRATDAGTVIERRAEQGEVVQAGQAIFEVARQDGRDAVFDVPAQLLSTVPADPEVTVTLVDNAAVTAVGHVREIAPQADPVTRNFRVRVGLVEPPEAMRLGTTVTGRVTLDTGPVIEIPATALTRLDGSPAVWVVDPKALTVALRKIDVLSFSPAAVTVAEGLAPDEIIVTAGVQALHPGQAVRLLEQRP